VVECVGFRPCADLEVAGFALAETNVIWDKLSQKERENVEAWLGNSINEKKYGDPFDSYLCPAADTQQYAKYQLALVPRFREPRAEEELRQVLAGQD
jgi:FPC/CPF motif-containing protein YcgG